MLVSYVDIEARIPARIPLRAIRGLTNAALAARLALPQVKPLLGAEHFSVDGTLSKLGKARKTAVPPEVAASEACKVSQRNRKRIEEGFGWGKTAGGLSRLKVRGLDKVRAAFTFAIAACDIVRLPKLIAPAGEVCPTTREEK